MTSFLSDENPNYKISFDCYSSYYYRSIFYINNLEKEFITKNFKKKESDLVYKIKNKDLYFILII